MRPRQELLQRLPEDGGQRAVRGSGVRTGPRDERHRQLDGKHPTRCRHRDMPVVAGARHIAVRLPWGAAEPLGQRPRSIRRRDTVIAQIGGSVDSLSELMATSMASRATHRHVTNVLLDMSGSLSNTPGPLNSPIAQRSVEAEVAHCVEGVIADPCGVPRSRSCTVPSGSTSGALSHRCTYSTTHRWSVLTSTALTMRS